MEYDLSQQHPSAVFLSPWLHRAAWFILVAGQVSYAVLAMPTFIAVMSATANGETPTLPLSLFAWTLVGWLSAVPLLVLLWRVVLVTHGPVTLAGRIVVAARSSISLTIAGKLPERPVRRRLRVSRNVDRALMLLSAFWAPAFFAIMYPIIGIEHTVWTGVHLLGLGGLLLGSDYLYRESLRYVANPSAIPESTFGRPRVPMRALTSEGQAKRRVSRAVLVLAGIWWLSGAAWAL